MATAGSPSVIEKARYWEKLRDVPLNDRQRLVTNRMLDGFEGKLTTSKWAATRRGSQLPGRPAIPNQSLKLWKPPAGGERRR
jgi:hypothetical protein